MQTEFRLNTTTLIPLVSSLLLAVACASVVAPAHARAACAPTESEPTDVAITKKPQSVLECVTVSVQGKWYCGAAPLVVFRNDCSSELTIDDSSFRCGGPGEREECSAVSQESVGSVELRMESEEGSADAGTTRHETNYGVRVGEESGTVTVEYGVTRTESGDAGGCAGQSTNARSTGTVVVLLFPVLALFRFRRNGILPGNG